MSHARIIIIVLAVGTIHWAAALTKADLPPQGSTVYTPYIFRRVSDNSDYDISSQLQVVLSTYEGDSPDPPDKVLFTFWNNGPIASSICDIYFDDGALVGLPDVVNSEGVSFTELARPKEFPGEAGMDPPFVTTQGFSVDSDPPVSINGVNPGEWVGVVFDLDSGKTIADVDQALLAGTFLSPGDDTEGTLRIGIRVLSLPDNDESDLYVHHIPAPSAVILGIVGLAGVRVFRRFGAG